VVKLAERPFPKGYERDLRAAVSQVLQTHPAAVARKPSLLQRIVAAVRKIFSA
jgi:hypothetical protein